MLQQMITGDEFCKRLAQLCLTGASCNLPPRPRDRAIILKSIALTLRADVSYNEVDLKMALAAWSGHVGTGLQVDHAALRRHLIDDRYLSRSADGRVYELNQVAHAELFAAEVNAINPAEVINQAILEAAAKREAFRGRQQP
jgi:hypothetical protein